MYDRQSFDKLLGSTPPSDSPLAGFDFHTKKVIVHYWTEYDTGRHVFIEIEAGADCTVLELMQKMVREVKLQLGIQKDVGSFVIRTSDKVGKPKIDVPVFETSQKVLNLGFARFALCDSEMDNEARRCLEEINYTQESIREENDMKVKTKSVWKKCFCCYSD